MRLGSYYRSEIMDRLGLLPRSGVRVLDVGCHDGMLLHRIGTGMRVGVDIRPVPAYPVRYVRADGGRLPFAPDSFDRIYLLEVIEHVRKKEDLLASTLRVLRPGGTLIISVPSRGMRIFPAALMPFLHERWGHGRDFRGFQEEEILRLLPEREIEDVRFLHFRARGYLRGYLILRLAWSLLSTVGHRWATRCAQRDSRGIDRGEDCALLIAIIRKA